MCHVTFLSPSFALWRLYIEACCTGPRPPFAAPWCVKVVPSPVPSLQEATPVCPSHAACCACPGLKATGAAGVQRAYPALSCPLAT